MGRGRPKGSGTVASDQRDIEAVLALMADDPSLSRNAAVKRVAGTHPSNVRRIMHKLQQMAAEAEAARAARPPMAHLQFGGAVSDAAALDRLLDQIAEDMIAMDAVVPYDRHGDNVWHQIADSLDGARRRGGFFGIAVHYDAELEPDVPFGNTLSALRGLRLPYVLTVDAPDEEYAFVGGGDDSVILNKTARGWVVDYAELEDLRREGRFALLEGMIARFRTDLAVEPLVLEAGAAELAKEFVEDALIEDEPAVRLPGR